MTAVATPMTRPQLVAARLTEVEKGRIRASDTEGAMLARYNELKPELAGGPLYGGTVDEGLAQMQEIYDMCWAEFRATSAQTTFGKTWKF